jgi:serine/threonine-protein kinase
VDGSTELPPLPLPGAVVDRYRVLLEIAHGGMAAVYAVQRSSIGGFEKVLALKVMLPHLATDQRFVNMFLDEARIASLIHHPNVVQVLDVGMHGRLPFILMEFLRGQSLASVLERAVAAGVPVPPEISLAILARAAEGLHAAHQTAGPDGKLLGVVHRDVSPHNVLVGYDGQIKVADFGIAAARGRLGGTLTGEVKGKLAFLAPEQVQRSSPVTPATDVWALGVVAWEIFAGRRLFLADDEATALWNVLNAPIPDIGGLSSSLPSVAAETIMACLKREPSHRPPSAAALAETFSRAARELGGAHVQPATLMDQLFSKERVALNERIATAQRRGAITPEERVHLHSAAPVTAGESTQLSMAGAPRAPNRRMLGYLLGLAVVALLVAVFLWIPRGAATSAVAPLEAPPAPSVTATARALQIDVDPRAMLALVDGARHDERPLALMLPSGGKALVELVGPDGRLTRRVVGPGDDHGTILLDEAPPAPSSSVLPPAPSSSIPFPGWPRKAQRSKTPPASSSTPAPASSLMKNPF